jgi:hypothetical protein
MDAARFDLAQVRQQRGEQLVRATDQAPCGGEQVGVGELPRQRVSSE